MFSPVRACKYARSIPANGVNNGSSRTGTRRQICTPDYPTESLTSCWLRVNDPVRDKWSSLSVVSSQWSVVSGQQSRAGVRYRYRRYGKMVYYLCRNPRHNQVERSLKHKSMNEYCLFTVCTPSPNSQASPHPPASLIQARR